MEAVEASQTIGTVNNDETNRESSNEDECNVPICTKQASAIQAIDKSSVHRICSGQVVLTLSTAVKELVENSIDAGATSIEIKLKEYGSESIEVLDNGSGVEERNFEGLTLKHHTSKLQDFDDLVNVTTFGFRGEALSSLCALSNMVIITRHKSAAVGTRLEFDLNGRIVSKKSSPRQIGTTVQVQNIFHTLPVRHKEFQRNLKKEFAKLVQILNAYCIVSTGVRISCSNQTSKGSRSTIVSTNGNEFMKENIANIFGPKQLQSLLDFKQTVLEDEVCAEFGIKPHQKSSIDFRIEGFVSKCEHGQGRSSSDRQFLYINKRPCDAMKILKLINEVYHGYNRHQNPFLALNITMDKESVDVNVTPDKRQIFMEEEHLLLAVLKTSLIQMFEPTTSVFRVNNFLPSTQTSGKLNLNNESDQIEAPEDSLEFERQSNTAKGASDGSSLSSFVSKLKRSFSSAFDRNDSSHGACATSPGKKSKGLLPSSARSNSLPSYSSNHDSIKHFLVSRFSPKKSLSEPSSQSTPFSAPVVRHGISSSGRVDSSVFSSSVSSPKELSEGRGIACNEKLHSESDSEINLLEKSGMLHSNSNSGLDNSYLKELTFPRNSSRDDVQKGQSDDTIVGDQTRYNDSFHHSFNQDMVSERTVPVNTNSCPRDKHFCMGSDQVTEDDSNHAETSNIGGVGYVYLTDLDLTDGEVNQTKKEQTISFSLSSLQERMEQLRIRNCKLSTSFSRSFRAKICPGDSKSAEDELQREISKDMFAKMEILGQFNLGFIITKLGSDLFIVDQHATDEKYNFEMLQQHTILQSQKLIVPQSLELTASNETILLDNMEVFKKNGFDFVIEPEAPPTQRVKLVSAPVSKNWRFGKEDIEELLFMLTDAPSVMCRPSRVRMMFASRACRKSVMIGTALNKSEMKRLVCHMEEIEQPWNCPHGRPTMRHLFNMDMLPS